MPTAMQQQQDRREYDRFTVDPMYSAVAVTPVASTRTRRKGASASASPSAPAATPAEGHVYEVSLGGMRFELDEPFENGSRVSVEVSLPGCLTPIRAEGPIVRVFDAEDDPGPRRMVVEFETFAIGARETLERYLGQKWLRRAPAPRVLETEQSTSLSNAQGANASGPAPAESASEPTCEVMIETNASVGKGSKKRKSASAA